MHPHNMAVLYGTILQTPIVRDLPAGNTVTQFDMGTEVEHNVVSVPVAFTDLDPAQRMGLVAHDRVLVIGHMARRFFRSGGATHSRTELVGHQIRKIPPEQANLVESTLDLVRLELTSW